MKEQEAYYNELAANFEGAVKSQLFGKPCYKIKGKAFVSFYQDCMVFKLAGKEHIEALALDGSQLFDPSGKKRPMKEWVQVSYNSKDKWPMFTKAAFDYVGSTSAQ